MAGLRFPWEVDPGREALRGALAALRAAEMS